MDVKCTLETKTSKKGESYKCLVVKLCDDYEKVVFLDKAELLLLDKISKEEETTTNPFESFK